MQRSIQNFGAVLLIAFLLAGNAVPGYADTFSLQPVSDSWSNVIINGQRLTQHQRAALERSVGGRIPAGVYLVDNNGCWVNVSTGAAGCLHQTSTFSRYGSGERTSDGSWNHYSNSAGMGVGGTSDGCIYTTTGWSNC